jgi:chemotaxis protein methyltransferase CheR
MTEDDDRNRISPRVAETVAAFRRRHGIDPFASLVMRDRFLAALAEFGGSDHGARLDAIADRLRVGETRFFREPDQLDAAIAHLARRPAGPFRILSAGCSTGEEAWTLAILLEEARARGAVDPRWEIVGVDALEAHVERAREARYEPGAMPARGRRFVVSGDREERIAPHLRGRVRFVRGDLLARIPQAPYDAIVCRNVLVYLEPEAADRLIENLVGATSPGALVVVARAEAGIARRAVGLSALGDAIFVRTSSDATARERPSTLAVDATTTPSRITRDAQALLASGAGTIELRIARLDPDQTLAVRRFLAAARALGIEVSAADPETSEVLARLRSP